MPGPESLLVPMTVLAVASSPSENAHHGQGRRLDHRCHIDPHRVARHLRLPKRCAVRRRRGRPEKLPPKIGSLSERPQNRQWESGTALRNALCGAFPLLSDWAQRTRCKHGAYNRKEGRARFDAASSCVSPIAGTSARSARATEQSRHSSRFRRRHWKAMSAASRKWPASPFRFR